MKYPLSDFFLSFLRKPDLWALWNAIPKPSLRFKFLRLLSLKSLIVMGFLVAVMPHFLGMMYTAFSMRETASLGKAINYQIFEQTKAILHVLQKTGEIERKARLFILLSDPQLRQPYERESYEAVRASFKQDLDELLKLKVANRIALLVNELSEKEKLIYQQVIGLVDDNAVGIPVDKAFLGLRESANQLSSQFEQHVELQFNELRRQSESLEQTLLVKGTVLFFISLVFIVGLLFVLSRSMRQLDASIRRLGSGELTEFIAVTGPSDLRYLGERLEWLRTHLMELEVSKQQFMHNVACEIEVPLETIRESAQCIVDVSNREITDTQRDLANKLSAGIEKLKQVSDELIRYSRINEKPKKNAKESVDMKELLESVLETLQAEIDAKSIGLRKLIRPVRVDGDEKQLRCIIEQLFKNAVKFSPLEGEIRIILRDSGTSMELEVEDEGPGINPDERENVFEPFYRGEAGRCHDGAEGSGLGLAIVKEYVANHQGRVEAIDARQDHQGARIRVKLPLIEEL